MIVRPRSPAPAAGRPGTGHSLRPARVRSRPPAARNETRIPRRQNALEPGFHDVPAARHALKRDADGADVTRLAGPFLALLACATVEYASHDADRWCLAIQWSPRFSKSCFSVM